MTTIRIVLCLTIIWTETGIEPPEIKAGFPKPKRGKRMEFAELREAIEQIEVVDSHAHNIVPLDSSFPFINSLSEATGHAVSFALHSLSFKRSLRDIAELYGTECLSHHWMPWNSIADHLACKPLVQSDLKLQESRLFSLMMD
ncbi:uncharacterized protein [Gossypium hirsutum]|uniref:Amidohydrolase-related domain-containing protein n=1 Tax=Gossypium hirsutum TaxID=3635 RepID=A0A1U8N085_GOSHI|nr:uncharacterized protein LOC107942096 [Gossypium hirsutum]